MILFSLARFVSKLIPFKESINSGLSQSLLNIIPRQSMNLFVVWKIHRVIKDQVVYRKLSNSDGYKFVVSLSVSVNVIEENRD